MMIKNQFSGRTPPGVEETDSKTVRASKPANDCPHFSDGTAPHLIKALNRAFDINSKNQLIIYSLFNFCSCGETRPDFQLTPYRAAFPNCGYLQHRVAPGVIHGTPRRGDKKYSPDRIGYCL
jgi:hypothetical protein